MQSELKQLREKGYLELPKLADQKVDSIVDQLHSHIFKEWHGKGEPITGLDFNKAQHNIYKALDQRKVLDIPEVKELSQNSHILKLVEAYLDGKPIQVQCNCWCTIKHNQPEGGQKFHQDYSFKRLIKLFLYLTDVDMDSGPHTFVPGSKNNLKTPDNYHPSLRVSDEFIEDNYKEIKYFTGPKGTMFLADTMNYHKGLPVHYGHRILIQFEWTDDNTSLATGEKINYIK